MERPPSFVFFQAWITIYFQHSQFVAREIGGLPADFQGIDGLTHALKRVMEDSHGRTGSFDEVAEILSEILHHTEVRNTNVKKCLNGKIFELWVNNLRVNFRHLHYELSYWSIASSC